MTTNNVTRHKDIFISLFNDNTNEFNLTYRYNLSKHSLTNIVF